MGIDSWRSGRQLAGVKGILRHQASYNLTRNLMGRSDRFFLVLPILLVSLVLRVPLILHFLLPRDGGPGALPWQAGTVASAMSQIGEAYLTQVHSLLRLGFREGVEGWCGRGLSEGYRALPGWGSQVLGAELI